MILFVYFQKNRRPFDMEENHRGQYDGKDESNLCRLCLGSANVTVHIGHHSDKSTTIADKIHYCTSLVVHCRVDIIIIYYFQIIARMPHETQQPCAHHSLLISRIIQLIHYSFYVVIYIFIKLIDFIYAVRTK